MDYPGGFSVVTRVLVRGDRDRRARVSRRFDNGSKRYE